LSVSSLFVAIALSMFFVTSVIFFPFRISSA
jgi:hypothetical protein